MGRPKIEKKAVHSVSVSRVFLWLLQAEVARARALAVKDEKEARARARALRRSEYGSNTAMQWCDPPKSTRHSHVSFQLR